MLLPKQMLTLSLRLLKDNQANLWFSVFISLISITEADTSSCSNTNSTPQQIVVTWEYSENFGAYQAFPVSLRLA